MYHQIDRHKIYSCALPLDGCGEQYVRKKFPEELKKLRAANYNKICLVVAIDADSKTVSQRRKSLDKMCMDAGVTESKADDLVMYFIPKRNIETWITYYSGAAAVNEDKDYGHNRGLESECKRMSQEMAKQFMTGVGLTNALSSLQAAKHEYDRIVQLMK